MIKLNVLTLLLAGLVLEQIIMGKYIWLSANCYNLKVLYIFVLEV